MKHTPGPWVVGEVDEHGGYDCMYCGIRVGPVRLDGSDYEQRSCTPISPEGLTRMLADARLIAAAPKLLEALRAYMMAGYGNSTSHQLQSEAYWLAVEALKGLEE